MNSATQCRTGRKKTIRLMPRAIPSTKVTQRNYLKIGTGCLILSVILTLLGISFHQRESNQRRLILIGKIPVRRPGSTPRSPKSRSKSLLVKQASSPTRATSTGGEITPTAIAKATHNSGLTFYDHTYDPTEKHGQETRKYWKEHAEFNQKIMVRDGDLTLTRLLSHSGSKNEPSPSVAFGKAELVVGRKAKTNFGLGDIVSVKNKRKTNGNVIVTVTTADNKTLQVPAITLKQDQPLDLKKNQVLCVALCREPQGLRAIGSAVWTVKSKIFGGKSYDCVLETLIVDPDMRGKGYGKQLLNHGMSLMKSKGCKNILLKSYPGAIKFYKRAGFQDVEDDDSDDTYPRMVYDLTKVN